MPDLHTAVRSAGEEHVVVDVDLRRALADVLEQALPRVLGREVVQTLVVGQVPHADAAVRAAGGEHDLAVVHGQALDGVVVGLEGVDQLVLAEIPNTNL